jgi:hypothetical protein
VILKTGFIWLKVETDSGQGYLNIVMNLGVSKLHAERKISFKRDVVPRLSRMSYEVQRCVGLIRNLHTCFILHTFTYIFSSTYFQIPLSYFLRATDHVWFSFETDGKLSFIYFLIFSVSVLIQYLSVVVCGLWRRLSCWLLQTFHPWPSWFQDLFVLNFSFLKCGIGISQETSVLLI